MHYDENGNIQYSTIERACLAIQRGDHDLVKKNFHIFDSDVTGEEVLNTVINKSNEET